jgi:hypothetical protein
LRRSGVVLGVIATGLLAGIGLAVLQGDRRGYLPPRSAPNLDEQTRRLEAELPLAASKKPYLVIDLLDSRLEYRISGMTPKILPFQIDSLHGLSRGETLSPARITLLELRDRGAPKEVIVPPDPNKPADPLKDPKLFPPDPPTDYTLLFDRPLTIRIVGEQPAGWATRLKGIEDSFRAWRRRSSGGSRFRIQIRLPADKVQEIYRGLYPGEMMLVYGIGDAGKRESPPARD